MINGHPVTFAALLRQHRLAAGLTQEELAQRSGLSRRGISDIERGLKRRPYRNTVARLATALSLAEAERIGFEEAARPAAIALHTGAALPGIVDDGGSADCPRGRPRRPAHPVSHRRGGTTP
jgi:transcriptional regulator with XRE-family HTH domain